MSDFMLVANTIRGLAMDGVQKAKSGHPGMPMGMADVATVLFLKHLNYSPVDPQWPDRDRFVLSAGHGSMLLYSLLHLAGYDLPLDELKRFRQWGSKTPGHPEYGHTVGVETTTGPLGQGIANAVGMAIAERMLADRFNTPDCAVADHRTFAICGDGCMMEGISHEACSLAGHLGLNKLILIYDFNHITIEGNTNLAYSDDVRKRFEGYRWNVIETDAHDMARIDQALTEAKAEKQRPTLIIAHSTIGKGACKLAGSHKCHGEPLGDDEIAGTKKALGMSPEAFHVPAEVREAFAARAREMEKRLAKWKDLMRIYREKYPEQAGLWEVFQKGRIPANLEQQLPEFDPAKPVATRVASGAVMQKLSKALPFLVGGAADLAPSTKTYIEGGGDIGPGSYKGVNFHFGVREHAMAAIMNGIASHGGFRVFGSTFFSFLDYCKSSVRLSAIMKLPVIYVFTHDSFYVGEDGPTHEPVEQTMSLRLVPDMTVIRPADPTETGAAWVAALKHKEGPVALLLTRQNLPVLDRKQFPPAHALEKGAYILWDSAPGAAPDLLFIATGSEVSLALDAAKVLAGECRVRVVSMPSWELFEKQDAAYRDSVLPPACRKRVSIEAGSTLGWQKYVGDQGLCIGLDAYGGSAPYPVLAEQYGFTPAAVVEKARAVLKR